MPLSHNNRNYFTKVRETQSYYTLSLALTTLEQQRIAVTTEQLAVCVGQEHRLLSSLEGHLQIFTLNSNAKFPAQVPSFYHLVTEVRTPGFCIYVIKCPISVLLWSKPKDLNRIRSLVLNNV